jgi:hypothetical protein
VRRRWQKIHRLFTAVVQGSDPGPEDAAGLPGAGGVRPPQEETLLADHRAFLEQRAPQAKYSAAVVFQSGKNWTTVDT